MLMITRCTFLGSAFGVAAASTFVGGTYGSRGALADEPREDARIKDIQVVSLRDKGSHGRGRRYLEIATRAGTRGLSGELFLDTPQKLSELRPRLLSALVAILSLNAMASAADSAPKWALKLDDKSHSFSVQADGVTLLGDISVDIKTTNSTLSTLDESLKMGPPVLEGSASDATGPAENWAVPFADSNGRTAATVLVRAYPARKILCIGIRYDITHALYVAAMDYMGNPGKLRIEKSYPEVFNYIGWCSWNAYREAMNEAKLLEVAQSFKTNGFPVVYFIVDCGWQSSNGDYHKFLKSCGADFVKVDNQCVVIGATRGLMPLANAYAGLQADLQESVNAHFNLLHKLIFADGAIPRTG